MRNKWNDRKREAQLLLCSQKGAKRADLFVPSLQEAQIASCCIFICSFNTLCERLLRVSFSSWRAQSSTSVQYQAHYRTTLCIKQPPDWKIQNPFLRKMRSGGFKLFYLQTLRCSEHLFHITTIIIIIIKGFIESSREAPRGRSARPGPTPDTRRRRCPASRTPSDVVRADALHAPPATRNPSTANYQQFPCWVGGVGVTSGRNSSGGLGADTHGSVGFLPR